MKISFLLLMIFFVNTICNAQTILPFEDFKNEVRTLWAKGDHSKSIELLLKRGDDYPEERDQHVIAYYLGLLYLETDQYELCFEVFNKGFDQSFFFSFWPSHLSKIKQIPNGKRIIDRNTENKTIYEKKASPKYEVILPENYDPKIAYPLVYFFHGNNSDLVSLKNTFQYVELQNELIVVLAQSSYARSNYSFDWIDDISSVDDLLSIHADVLKNHAVDTSKIIVSGFSNGGRMAISAFNNKVIPTEGFIAFNPSRTTITSNNTDKLKGAIITGERDYLLADQIAMANTFYDLSLELRLVVLPDHGHNYPKTFAQELNKSIESILKKE